VFFFWAGNLLTDLAVWGKLVHIKMSFNKDQITYAIKSFSDLKMLVVGDVMLDQYDFCHTAKSRELHSEKKGKRAYWVQESKKMLGGAGNVALNLKSLGAQVSLVGISGDDSHYHALLRESGIHGLDTFLVKDSKRSTTIKNRIYVDGEYVLRKDHESLEKIGKRLSKQVLRFFQEKILDVDAVILSDYGKGLFAKHNAPEIIQTCNSLNIPTIVDFKPANCKLFAGATIMSPNFHEAKELLSSFAIDEDLDFHVRSVADRLQGKQTVVTLHDSGICGLDENDEFYHLAANEVSEIDAVGCGDTVRSLLALGVASKLSFEETLALANDGASIAVTKQGTSTITPTELLEFIQQKY
jgi:D-beta-D-heptose 7-phosphate kinase/D-beta-D-heptose 1-phosphate adenosyltransferase